MHANAPFLRFVGFARAPHGDDDNKIQTGMDPDPIGDSFLIPESGSKYFVFSGFINCQIDNLNFYFYFQQGAAKAMTYHLTTNWSTET